MLRRVLEPVDDDIPNPGFDFEACIEAVVERTTRTVKPLSKAERHVYFLSPQRRGMVPPDECAGGTYSARCAVA